MRHALLVLALAWGCGDKAAPPDDSGAGDGADGASATDADGDGYAEDDCDDTRPDVSPGADEVCDGLDNDCDGEVDEDAVDREAFYLDADGDGHGDPDQAVLACEQGRYATLADDCDDGDAATWPGADELCDGVDNDCDDEIDEDATDPTTFYADADADGFGDDDDTVEACVAPPGFAAVGGDCDDARGDVSPDATEVCDGVDNDCDGAADANRVPGDFATIGDAVSALADGAEICVQPGTYTERVSLGGRSLTVSAAGGPDVTTFDLAGATRPFLTHSGTGSSAVVQGFTFTGSNRARPASDSWLGDVVRVTGGGELELRDVVVRSNRFAVEDDGVDHIGGGVYVAGATLRIVDSTFEQNRVLFTDGSDSTLSAFTGGVLAVAGSGTLELEGVHLDDNYVVSVDDPHGASIRGGLLAAIDGATLRVTDSTLSRNTVDVSYTSSMESVGDLVHVVDATLEVDGLVLDDNAVEVAGRYATTEGLIHVEDAVAELVDVVATNNSVEAVTAYTSSSAASATGPLYVYQSDVTIDGFQAWSNRVEAWHTDRSNAIGGARGGGLVLYHSNVDLMHADLRDNLVVGGASASGAGMAIASANGDPTVIDIRNSVVAGNRAGDGTGPSASGGGVAFSCRDHLCSLTQVTLYGNTCEATDSASGGNLTVSGSRSTLQVANNTVTGGQVLAATTDAPGISVGSTHVVAWEYNNYDALSGYGGDSSDMDVDPGFTDVSGTDPTAWDLTLASGSALIDAGDPGGRDADGTTSDVGAYGGPSGSW